MAAGLSSAAAGAAEYTYSLGYRAEYSDNVHLVANNEEDELVHVMSAGFQITERKRELDIRAQARASYQYYTNEAFADEASFGLDGAVVWKPAPEAFHFTVQDVYTQVAADPVAADTPANQVNANVFTTGPDIFWRLSAVHTLQVSGRYAWSNFDKTENTEDTIIDESESDNVRRNATVRWLYRSSPTATFSVSRAIEAVELDDPLVGNNFDYRRTDTTAGVEKAIGRNNFSLHAGETRIRRVNQPEISGGSGRVAWTREITSEATFSLSASRSLSDITGEILAGAGDVDGVTASISADIYVLRQATATYSRRSGAGAFALSLFRTERIYELAEADNEESQGASMDYTYAFTPVLSASLNARYTETFFPTLLRDDEVYTAGVGVRYRFSRTLSGGLAYTRQSRTSTDAAFEFVENRAVLSLGYNSLPSRW